ncbi:MAG: acetyl-CoA decarbonylase/synthase complex subunit gamma, partial [Candidatus Altiarchaeota archaeon]|nr:acetyl-CoA decarbonylase/synthase complex subunit gamma [Candidatus Altiarchaeota archaeon]
MAKKASVMEIYKYLPAKDCGSCGSKSCMDFAVSLVKREKSLDACMNMDPQNKEILVDLLLTPVREVTFGLGKYMRKFGGESVMYRHELKFFNPTILALEVSDSMPDEEITERAKTVNERQTERVNVMLSLDAVAIKLSDKLKAEKVAKLVNDNCSKPLILISSDIEILRKALAIVGKRRPLLYGADERNITEMIRLAKENNCPLVIRSGDLQKLGDLANKARKEGLEDLVLDPATAISGRAFKEFVDRCVQIRRAAVEKDVKPLGFPIISTPSLAYSMDADEFNKKYYEAFLASVFMLRYSSIVVVKTGDVWANLPLMTLRENLFADPKEESRVDAGLYEIGKPDETSPVLMTVNYALTFHIIKGDLERAKLNCYLLVLDTKGFAVDTAVAVGSLNSGVVKESIEKFKLPERVRHKKIIIPELATRLSGAINEETGWEV